MVVMTGYSDVEAMEQAINTAGIFNYLTKPWDDGILCEIVERANEFLHSQRERERLQILTKEQNKKLAGLARLLDKRVKERTIEIEQALTLLQCSHNATKDKFVESLKVVSQILDWKEGRDFGHNRFVVEYSDRLAKRVGMNEVELEDLSIAAQLHRIGILGVPDSVREKPQYLFTSAEKQVFREMPILGQTVLSEASGLAEAARIIRHQFEWINGNGTPDGLILDEIPIASKIIHIVGDFFDVFNGRVIERVQGVDAGCDYLKQWAGKKYDAALVNEFIDEVQGFNIQLNNCGELKKLTELEPGMVLHTSIVNQNGMLLLSKGTELTEININALKDFEESKNEYLTISVQLTDGDK